MLIFQFVFLVGGFILAGALVPTILDGGGPTLSTSLLTAVVLSTYTVSFAWQKMWWSTVGLGLNVVAWAILAVQAVQ